MYTRITSHHEASVSVNVLFSYTTDSECVTVDKCV